MTTQSLRFERSRRNPRIAGHNRTRKALSSATCQTSAGSALAALLLLSTAAHAADYKVGVLLPFSGVYAGLGSHIENGFNLGLEHFAADLGADSITTVKADTEANPGSSLAKTKKMVLQDKARRPGWPGVFGCSRCGAQLRAPVGRAAGGGQCRKHPRNGQKLQPEHHSRVVLQCPDHPPDGFVDGQAGDQEGLPDGARLRGRPSDDGSLP